MTFFTKVTEPSKGTQETLVKERYVHWAKGIKGHFAHTEETRARMRAAKKGKTVSAETRAKTSAALKGKTKSAETCAKMSATKRQTMGNPVMTPDGWFPSVRAVAEARGCSTAYVHALLKTKPTEFYYVNKGE